MPGFNDGPCWYIILALIVSFYQAYRGFMFQWILAKERKSSERMDTAEQGIAQQKWTRSQKIVLLCVADMFFYLVTTLAGFLSLFVAYYVLNKVPCLTEIGAGLSALLIFLILFGLLGVCGQLPYLIQLGKFPWKN